MSHFCKFQGRFQVNGRVSKSFEMQKLIKQADSLSSLLFIIVMGRMIKKARNRVSNLKQKKEKRRKGRPKKMWMDQIVKTQTKMEEP